MLLAAPVVDELTPEEADPRMPSPSSERGDASIKPQLEATALVADAFEDAADLLVMSDDDTAADYVSDSDSKPEGDAVDLALEDIAVSLLADDFDPCFDQTSTTPGAVTLDHVNDVVASLSDDVRLGVRSVINAELGRASPLASLPAFDDAPPEPGQPTRKPAADEPAADPYYHYLSVPHNWIWIHSYVHPNRYCIAQH